MEISEIYLNRLCESAELYKEVADKLGIDRIKDSASLSGALMGLDCPHTFKLYVSDENVDNPAVDEITEVFRS